MRVIDELLDRLSVIESIFSDSQVMLVLTQSHLSHGATPVRDTGLCLITG